MSNAQTHLLAALGAVVLALATASPGAAQANPCDGSEARCTANSSIEFRDIDAPENVERGVFVTQIGSANAVNTRQRNNSSTARVGQNGNDNSVILEQRADGKHYAAIGQAGDENTASALQDGDGDTVLLLAQEGNLNAATISQTDNGLASSAAALQQVGNGNSLTLVQNGDDNQARLTQNGDNNAMTATQLDTGNRLEWIQEGTGLPDLAITQEGGASLYVSQSNTGGGS